MYCAPVGHFTGMSAAPLGLFKAAPLFDDLIIHSLRNDFNCEMLYNYAMIFGEYYILRNMDIV